MVSGRLARGQVTLTLREGAPVRFCVCGVGYYYIKKFGWARHRASLFRWNTVRCILVRAGDGGYRILSAVQWESEASRVDVVVQGGRVFGRHSKRHVRLLGKALMGLAP